MTEVRLNDKQMCEVWYTAMDGNGNYANLDDALSATSVDSNVASATAITTTPGVVLIKAQNRPRGDETTASTTVDVAVKGPNGSILHDTIIVHVTPMGDTGGLVSLVKAPTPREVAPVGSPPANKMISTDEAVRIEAEKIRLAEVEAKHKSIAANLPYIAPKIEPTKPAPSAPNTLYTTPIKPAVTDED